MVVNFDAIAGHSRLWIYQIDKKLNTSEETYLLNACTEFLTSWTAHGSQLNAAVKIVDSQILIISADETNAGASGCSIDSQMAFLRDVQIQMGIDLFSRGNIFYKQDDNLKSMEINEFKQKISNSELSDETLFYNTTIHKKEQLEDNFIIPVKNSWLMRMIAVS